MSSSTTSNDENMLVVTGDTEAADVYFTEYNRIFDHFYARWWAQQSEALAVLSLQCSADDRPAVNRPQTGRQPGLQAPGPPAGRASVPTRRYAGRTRETHGAMLQPDRAGCRAPARGRFPIPPARSP